MAITPTWDANFEPPPAFAGMLADNMVTDKVTVPAGAFTHPFGTVIAYVASTGISVLPIGTNPIAGVAIHDHRFGARSLTAQQGAYIQYDAISVATRGRIWVKASGTCTKDAVAKYDPATGIFADAGSATLANAKFLTANITIPDIAGGGSQIIALAELHSPAI